MDHINAIRGHATRLQNAGDRVAHRDEAPCTGVLAAGPTPDTKVDAAVNHDRTGRGPQGVPMCMGGVGRNHIRTKTLDGIEESTRRPKWGLKVCTESRTDGLPEGRIGRQDDPGGRRRFAEEMKQLCLPPSPLAPGVDVQDPHLALLDST
jgi:hypothetical protein